MKKLLLSFSGLVTYSFSALPAFAQTPAPVNPCPAGTTGIAGTLCGLGTNIPKTLQGIIVFFVILAVVIALLYLLFGGVKWITSRGDKAEVEAARNHIMAAIIGLIVVILAVFILSVILAAFGISWTSLQIPVIGK